jgi:FemAB-related protein (PEP-CTERM system-associated)
MQAPRDEPCEVTVFSELPAWEHYLRARHDATIYHDPRWGRVMAEVYGNRPFYLTATRGGRIVGVLQLIRQKSILFGSHLCSVPYFDAAGILADDEVARQALMDRARGLRTEHGVEWVELRQIQPIDESLPTRMDKVTLHLALPDNADELWQALRGTARNRVRKGEKAGLTAADGDGELVEEFHAVYSRNMRDLGSPPHGRRFFEAIARQFGDSVRLFVVRQDGEPLAACMTLADRHAIRTPWVGSDSRARDLCPNMLLYWRMLAHACDSDAGCFDFGRSTRDKGTYEFKRRWGAEPVQLYWHYLMPEGKAMPELRPDSPKYRFMVACWKKLPVWMARAIGPRIIAKVS